MEKINVAELLKDCPRGMELDCTMFDTKVFYQGLNKRIPTHPITVQTEHGFEFELTQYGQIHNIVGSKCVIFPKGKTTWEGFVPPCQFKDGGILATYSRSVFFLNTRLNTDEHYGCYVGIRGDDGSFHICEPFAYKECCGLATEEEKQKLFKAIKDNGYRWNAETKTLEKLPKFKVGDRIKHKDSDIYCTLGEYSEGISAYRTNIGLSLTYKDLEHWELFPAPDKFDISTLIPFESRVLVRDTDRESWLPAVFGFFDECEETRENYNTVGGGFWKQCIPFENNESLINTTEDCDDFYKTWEE